MKWLALKRLKSTGAQQQAQLLLGYANEQDVVALFTLLGLLAKSNGVVSQAEIQETQRFMDCYLPLSLHELAKSAFKAGKQTNLVRGVISKNAFVLYWNRSVRWLEPFQVLDVLLKVAFSDGEYSSWEEYIIDSTRATLGIHKRTYWILRDRLAEQMNVVIKRSTPSFASAAGFSDLDEQGAYKRFEEDRQQTNSRFNESDHAKRGNMQANAERGDPYKVLQVHSSANKEEIKKAYRRLVKLHHPDMLRNGTGSEQELTAAVDRFCEIQWAYETLMLADVAY